jgi:membrane protease YdiL (CAAX protease family)
VSHQAYYIEHIEPILFFSVIGFVLNWIASQKNFYQLPAPSSTSRITLLQVIALFCLYLSSSYAMIFPIFQLLKLSKYSGTALPILASSASSFCSALLLMGCSLILSKQELRKIWKSSHSSWIQDITMGAIAWLPAFPLVGIVEQAADILVYALFGVETYEQEAVRFLKAALSSSSTSVAALCMVLGTAPLVEEFLFRGLLQTWIKKHLGVKAAILIASLCFALFHISASHGMGNLSLIPSLFTFSCFLGFIYERQQSLLSSIALHSLFNLITSIRLIFFEAG